LTFIPPQRQGQQKSKNLMVILLFYGQPTFMTGTPEVEECFAFFSTIESDDSLEQQTNYRS
jgi:hypothetical protein